MISYERKSLEQTISGGDVVDYDNDIFTREESKVEPTSATSKCFTFLPCPFAERGTFEIPAALRQYSSLESHALGNNIDE